MQFGLIDGLNQGASILVRLASGLIADRWLIREEYRLAIVVGILGGFTTFSSFGWDTTEMLREGQVFRAATNVIVQNVAGIALVFAGYALVRMRTA